MRRRIIVGMIAIGLGVLFSALPSKGASAVETGNGGTGSGSGSVPTCSAEYSGIHQPQCGVNGGGKSWRIYKVTKNTTNLSKLNSHNTVPSGKKKWNVAQSNTAGGNDITGSNGLLQKCASKGYPYIILFGLNTVAVASNATPTFYVMFNRNKKNNKCSNNRGCYYKMNTYDSISSAADLQNKIKNNTFYSGQTLTNAAALGFYNKELKDEGKSAVTSSAFKAVGGFCSDGDDVTTSVKYTLTAKSVDTSGASLASVAGLGDDTDTTDSGDEASVVHGSNYYYEFRYWSNYANGSDNIGTGTEYSKVLTSNYTVYAVFRKYRFTLTAASRQINSTTSLAGVTGLSNTSMTVDRGGTATVSHGNTETGFTFKCWSEVENTDCSSNAGTGASYTVSDMQSHKTIYAIYEPFSATSTLDIKIKNSSSTIDAYKDYTDNDIYAKPNDVIGYKVTYAPLAQGGVNLKPQQIKIDSSAAQDNDATPLTLRVLFNNKKSTSLGVWSNNLMVSGDLGSYSDPFEYEVGVTDSKSFEATSEGSPSTYSVLPSKAGHTLTQTVSLQYNASGTTPKSVSIGVNAGKSIANVGTKLSDSARVKVPFNFENTTSVITPEDTLVYAGESASFDISIKVNKRHNAALDSDYATRVPGAKWKIGISYNGSAYSWGNIWSGTLNNSGNMDPTNDEPPKKLPMTIPDLSAGSRICIQSAVYPKDSHDDLNLSQTAYDVNDDGSWAYSTPKCYTVAKRPSLQIWGGNIYTGGEINTSLSKKRHLADYNNYSTTLNDEQLYIFGSWGELGMVSVGKVTGFASGAGLGYLNNAWPNTLANDTSSKQNPRPGGYSGGYDFCKLSLLTMANEVCKNSNRVAGSVGNQSATNGINNDKNAIANLVEALGVGESAEVSEGGININADTAKYYNANSKVTVNGGTLPKNRTVLIYAEDDITISGDIHYEQNGYSNLLDASKVVIYSKNNILIDCGVTRIDGLLIANVVNTCDKDINSRDSSRQLVIYGAVIANRLEANRTYGAAAGVNSMVSAEIIDFDPTLYWWKGFKGEEDESEEPEDDSKDESTFDSVYLRELAPRY